MSKRLNISTQPIKLLFIIIFLSLPCMAQTFGDIALSQSILSGTRRIGVKHKRPKKSVRKNQPSNRRTVLKKRQFSVQRETLYSRRKRNNR